MATASTFVHGQNITNVKNGESLDSTPHFCGYLGYDNWWSSDSECEACENGAVGYQKVACSCEKIQCFFQISIVKMECVFKIFLALQLLIVPSELIV
jgi:hypothetical protein